VVVDDRRHEPLESGQGHGDVVQRAHGENPPSARKSGYSRAAFGGVSTILASG
jgi:hypothetical protein